eukprot:gene25699-biopygen4520
MWRLMFSPGLTQAPKRRRPPPQPPSAAATPVRPVRAGSDRPDQPERNGPGRPEPAGPVSPVQPGPAGPIQPVCSGRPGPFDLFRPERPGQDAGNASRKGHRKAAGAARATDCRDRQEEQYRNVHVVGKCGFSGLAGIQPLLREKCWELLHTRGWMEGWRDGGTDGWMDGWMEGWRQQAKEQRATGHPVEGNGQRGRNGTCNVQLCILHNPGAEPEPAAEPPEAPSLFAAPSLPDGFPTSVRA